MSFSLGKFSFQQKPKLEFVTTKNRNEVNVSACPSVTDKKGKAKSTDLSLDVSGRGDSDSEECNSASHQKTNPQGAKHSESVTAFGRGGSKTPNMDAEEKLRRAITNYFETSSRMQTGGSGPSSESPFARHKKQKARKPKMPESRKSSNVEKVAASYSGYQPAKSKRRRVVLLDDDEDDVEDIENIRPMKKCAFDYSTKKTDDNVENNSSFGDEEVKEIHSHEPEKNDVEKLKEIYSGLTDREAAEALRSSGGLTDAILDLVDQPDKYRIKKDTKRKEAILDSYVVEEELSSESDSESLEMTSSQRVIWSFFEDASMEDIANVPGCSEKKAADIVKYRPFENYQDLRAKISKIKGVSSKILEDCYEFIQEQKKLDQLMKKCKRIANRIEAVISQVSPENNKGGSNDVQEVSHSPLEKQPGILNKKFKLKQYQLEGLNWLITLHKEGVNGILADQMGLGKTIQTLAFIGHLIENGHHGPHLIIVPSSTCDNWLREIETWLPTVKYAYYRGSQDERIVLREDLLYGDEDYNVILSTYNIVTSSPKDRSLFRKLETHYLVLDEGHMIKNMKSQRYKNLMEIKATRRLLLTGTPIQNNLIELMSLLSFVMPDLFVERISGINMIFGSNKKTRTSYQDRSVKAAKNIIKPFILRRLKQNVLKDLPEKLEKLIMCDVTQKQRVFYDSFVAKYKSLADKKLDYGSALGFLMKLRKTANHPLLERNLFDKELISKMAKDYIKQLENSESTYQFVVEDMEVMSDFELHNLCNEKYYLQKYRLQTEAILSSGKFKQLDVLLPRLKEKGSRVLLFSQFTSMLDIMEPYLKHLKYRFLRLDGQTPVAERLDLIDKYNNSTDIFVFLLSTKAGGLGINLTSADVVILHDIDFNPYNDKQAEDRCHRVGQQRDVTIYKLISKDTIEEGILKCANRKLNLEKDIAGHNDEGDKASEDDVKFLMGNL